MEKLLFITLITLLFVSCDPGLRTAKLGDSAGPKTDHELMTQQYMIASQGPLTSEAAKQMFASGGNIVDAAVAASMAISVERPHSTGLGGGGFLLFYDAKIKKTYVYDFREVAPNSFHKKIFVDKDGKQIKGKSSTGPFAVGVPGTVRGLAKLHADHGKLNWDIVLGPAIKMATSMPMYQTLHDNLKRKQERLSRYEATKKIFYKEDGSLYQVGESFSQKDLARTLTKISKDKGEDFYKGETAKKIIAAIKKEGGSMTMKDLAEYEVKMREPIRGKFKGYEIVSMPPPSSGGAHIIQILNILEEYDLKRIGVQSPMAIHLTTSAMQMAFYDRSKYMGDADFSEIPVKKIISKEYAKNLRKLISLQKARGINDFEELPKILKESDHTTHFSIMDKHGNVIVSTQTINGLFGSAMIAEGTGVMLNNEMDDFAASSTGTNIYGMLGGDNNLPEPKKRPLSSMSPTIVFKGGQPVLAVGTPNGPRILTCVMHTILNYIEYRMPLWESVSATRFHHQWSPDKLRVDAPFFKEETLETLRVMGYEIDKNPYTCRIQAISKEGELLHGVSDMRAEGKVLGE